tara:strand:+ start:80 stop:2671 length:2592 start_codon:yes stop_codon:yes gene_type:complete
LFKAINTFQNGLQSIPINVSDENNLQQVINVVNQKTNEIIIFFIKLALKQLLFSLFFNKFILKSTAMKASNIILMFKFIFVLFLFSSFSLSGQEDSEISTAYEDYTEAPREVVYLHINKSTYIKGETIGFKAYVMDKNDKKLSALTTNLYVSIEDKNKKVLQQKLILVENGVASNTFELDSTFTSGYYNIKAYTNWMLNFNEQNHYQESIKVIDPSSKKYIEEELLENVIDAQFLPESGHLLNGVINNVGVVIKNNLGFGVPNVEGEVLDRNNEVLSLFETNQFGVGQFQLLADLDNSYKVKITNANKEFSFNINENIEARGIIISLKSLKSKVFVSVITNSETLEAVKNKRHTLMIHNGNSYDIMDIYFTDETVVTKAIEYSNSALGVNILTLFNENDKPIAERLFFNHQGLNVLTSNTISATKTRDTVEVNLNFKDIDTKSFNSLSISVLPQETKSYGRHNNIISYTYLQPYIKGAIEQAKYYFTDIDAKKKYELDNLLLTQGWSSYNWNDIFKNTPNQTYSFEQGIKVMANRNNQTKRGPATYMLHASAYHQPVLFELSADERTFAFENIFPSLNESIQISEVSSTSNLKPAQLYLQFFPSTIPQFNSSINALNPKIDFNYEAHLNNIPIFTNLDGVQSLDEVVIMGRLEKKRIEAQKLTKSSWGKIHVFDDNDRQRFATLAQFINNMTSFRAYESNSLGLVVENPTTFTQNTGSSPFFFLDDMPLYNTNILSRYPMFNVDYIEINSSGIGDGIRGGNGTIKIYTKPSLRSNRYVETAQVFKLPLVFSETKKYYVPKYRSYTDDFYKGYGTVNWKPELTTDNNGNIKFKIATPEVPVTLFIEGITLDGSFIFEKKSISLN